MCGGLAGSRQRRAPSDMESERSFRRRGPKRLDADGVLPLPTEGILDDVEPDFGDVC